MKNSSKNRQPVKRNYKLRFSKLAATQATVEKAVDGETSDGEKFFTLLKKNNSEGLSKTEKAKYRKIETRLKIRAMKNEFKIKLGK